MRVLKIIFLIFLFVFSYPSYAKNSLKIDLNNLDTLIPIDKTIRRGTLANGLVYYIKKNAKPEKRMELRLVVKAGAINEDADQNGIAHFTEHMLFNGTKHFPKNDLVHYLEKIGVRFGADLNAYTGFDRTVYKLPIPTDKPELISSGLKILADWAGQATFNTEEIDKERGVVLEEWRLRQGAFTRANKAHQHTLYYGSKLEQHDVIGTPQVIKKASYATIRRFYHDWYRPNLMAVIVVGDIDVADIEKQIKATFSSLKNPDKPRQLAGDDIKIHANKKPLISIYGDNEQTYNIVQIFYKKPKEKSLLLRKYKHDFMHQMASAILAERMNVLLQKSNPPFQLAGMYYGNFFRDTNVFSIYSIPSTENFIKGYRATLTEVFRGIQHGFSENEYERAKINLLTSLEKIYTNRNKIKSADLASEYIRNFLDEETIPGIELEYAIYQNFSQTVSIDDINQMIQDYISPDNMLLTVTTAQKDGVSTPTKEQLLTIYQTLKNTKFASYHDDFLDKPLFSKKVTAGSIIKTTKIKEIGLTEFILSNGIKVLVKPTDFHDSEILFQAFSKGGNSLVPEKDYLNGNYATQIVTAGGIADFNKITLQKILTGKQVSLSPYIDNLKEGFDGSTTPKDAETLFQLLHLYFTQPHKDKESFNAFISHTKQWVDDFKRSPSSEFYESISYIMSGNDPRSKPVTKEMIESLDLNKAYEIYQQRFADASDFTFVFVGNINLEKFKPFLNQYLASLPTKGTIENFKNVFNDKPKQGIKKDFYKGREDKSSVILKINGDAEYNEKNIYTAKALEKIVNYRLTDILREEKGEIYSAWSSINISHYPKSEYAVNISFGCKPSNVESLIKSVETILQELQVNLPTDEDMQKVKQSNKRQYEKNLKENNYWINHIVKAYNNDLDVKEILNYPSLIENLTKNDIKQVAKKYFKLDTLKEFVLYPAKTLTN